MADQLTPAQRALRARIAINTRISRPDYNAHDATRAATAASWEKLFDEVDPGRTLPAEERERKAKAAWSARMLRAKFEKSRKHSAKTKP